MYSTLVSLLNFKTPATEKYSVVSEQGPFELRLYHRMNCASMSLTGPFNEIFKMGIHYLDEYRNGNNFKFEKIDEVDYFFQMMKENTVEIGFFFPVGMTFTTIPKPINRTIRLKELGPAKFATLRFKGHESNELFIRRAQDLKKWIEYQNLKMPGKASKIQSDFNHG
jgi:hypothetical protein